VESVADLPGRGDLAILLSGNAALGFLADNVVAQLDALIADEHRRAGDQLANLVLRLPAEAAVEGALTVRTAEFGHILVHRPRRQPGVGRQGIRLRNVAPKASISIASTLIAPACSRLKGQGC